MAARLTTYVVVGIVAATLIAGLIVGAQRNDTEGPVDLIVFNGKVYTADPAGTMAEAVAVRGNQVLRVGSNRDITRLRRPQTIVVDARGGAVLPGFNDVNVRLITGGLSLDAVDLLDAGTLDEIQARVQAWAEANPERPWVVGRGWYPESLPNGSPTRQLLDTAVADRPAYILSADGRAAWVNTKAVRLAGVTRHTPQPKNGLIVKESRTGEPSGLFKGEAVALAARVVPHATIEERARALRAAITLAHRNGITSVQDTTAGAEELPLFEEARRAGDLRLRVFSSVDLMPASADRDIGGLEGLSSKYPDDPIFKVGGARLAIDGEIETHTAALLEAYADRPSSGDTAVAPEDLNRAVRLLDARGWQIIAEAAGDRAVRMALDAYEHAARSNPLPPRGRRHRLERIGVVHAADVPRFGSLGIIASLQPVSAPVDARMERWLHRVGPERAARAWPAASIAAAGGRLALGSGWPAAALNPLAVIHAAVNRTPPAGPFETMSIPEEGISLKRAIDAYTSVPAYASFDEQRKGVLKAGMLADIVVLSGDIFKTPAARLASTEVEATIFDGRVVYRRGAKSTD
jgi:predicted amidohydrolase YtcJ